MVTKLKTTRSGKKSGRRRAASAKTTSKQPSSTRRRTGAVQTSGKHLVIVESPTKAKTVNRYVGSDYIVMASVGHVRDLPTKSAKGSKMPVPGVDLDNNFKPTYEILPNKKSTVSELKRAARQALDVWFATDLDREGEAIAWHLAKALDVPLKGAKRVVFNAITKSDIAQAFANPRQIDENRVNAQQARRILDRIVGFQISPLLWKKVTSGLSAGRVQSVAVRLVVDRERQIDAFVPDEHWKITAILATDVARTDQLARSWMNWLKPLTNGNNRTGKEQLEWMGQNGCIRAELVEIDGRIAKIANRETALAIATRMGFSLDQTHVTQDPKGKGPAQFQCAYEGHVADAPPYTIKSIQTKRTTSRPPAPFITSSLQQVAANRFGFGLQRTMRIAQQLYEGVDIHGREGQIGLITYMRTDSTQLSNEALKMGRSFIEQEWGDAYLPETANIYASPNQSAQEAHEAIRPTDVAVTPRRVRKELTQEQFKLYQLIWERFLASQMKPAQWDLTTVLVTVDGHGEIAADAILKTTGRTLAFDGFYKVSGVPTSWSGGGETAILPPIKEGQTVGPMQIEPTQHFTTPPPRYTEASLQKKLEKEGIGRPSTYAPIIATIQHRKYVQPLIPRDQRLMATDLGIVVTDMLVDAFPKVMDIAYTREMEDELDKIESDRHDWMAMLHAFYRPFKKSLERAHEELTHAKAKSEPAPHTCPKCGAGTEYRFGRNGRFLSCSGYFVPPESVTLKQNPRQKFLLYKAKGKARPKITSEDGKTKVGWTTLTPEQKDTFQKLSDKMPQPCKFAAPIDAEGNPIEPQVCDILCPVCDGPMTQRVGRFGPFLGCAAYPTCKGIVKLDAKRGTVVLPKPPPYLTDLACPKCEQPLNLRRSKRGPWLSCSSFPKCHGRLGWKLVDPAKANQLETALVQHESAQSPPPIRNREGLIVDDHYIPHVRSESSAEDT